MIPRLLTLLAVTGFLVVGSISAQPGPVGNLGVSIQGCEDDGFGDHFCVASVSGGSGSYNYWFQYDGNGQMLQDNTDTVAIFGCTEGVGTLDLQVFDRVTGATAVAGTFLLDCNEYDYRDGIFGDNNPCSGGFCSL